MSRNYLLDEMIYSLSYNIYMGVGGKLNYDAVGLKGCGGAEGHKLVKCEVQKGTN